jgi:hypothetical protein
MKKTLTPVQSVALSAIFAQRREALERIERLKVAVENAYTESLAPILAEAALPPFTRINFVFEGQKIVGFDVIEAPPIPKTEAVAATVQ